MTEPKGPDGENRLPRSLMKLGSYEWPRSQARQTLGHLFEKIKLGFLSRGSDDAVETEDLEPLSDEAFKSDIRASLAKVLCGILDTAYSDWTGAPGGNSQRRAFVHPPMEENVLLDWATRKKLPILEQGQFLDELGDVACVVIPRLEVYFSRDYTKLTPLFDLLDSLSGFDGKVLIGCNSWAWRFLKQFDDALLLFGEADILPPFDADALAAIIEDAVSDQDDRDNFMSIESGSPILARDDDGELTDAFLQDLAGRSIGHPWVAFEMFFSGIAQTRGSEDDVSDGRTWVKLPAPHTLPASGADALLFALHALMIHGPRKPETLNELLPHRAPNGLWTELNRTGFVDIKDNVVHCAICSYPDIRSELGAAGFNLDEL